MHELVMKTKTLATLFLALQGAAAQTVLTTLILTEPPNQGRNSNSLPAINYTNIPPAENANHSVSVEPLKSVRSNGLDISRANITTPIVLTITSTYVTEIVLSSTASSLFISKSQATVDWPTAHTGSTPASSSWNNLASSSIDASTQSSPPSKTVMVTDSSTFFTSGPSPAPSVLTDIGGQSLTTNKSSFTTSPFITLASTRNGLLPVDTSAPIQAVITTSSANTQDSSHSSAGSDVNSQATASPTTVKTSLASTDQTSQTLQSTSSVGNTSAPSGITILSTVSVQGYSSSTSPSSKVSTSSTSSSAAIDITSNLQSAQGLAVSVGAARVGQLTPILSSPESIQSTSTPLNQATITDPTITPTPTLSSIIPALATATSNTASTIAISITITAPVVHPGPSAPTPKPFTANVDVSKDGKCGSQYTPWITCLGSQFGPCCSVDGVCGNDEEHCRPTNCAVYFGYCGPAWIGKEAPRLDLAARRGMAQKWRRTKWEWWNRE